MDLPLARPGDQHCRYNMDTVTRVRRQASGSPTRKVRLTVYIGIDGSQAQHDVCFLDEADKATVFRSLRTSPLPVTHGPVGDCWQNSRGCLLMEHHSCIYDFVSQRP